MANILFINGFLKVPGLAKSVYYYTLSKTDKNDKNEIIDKIKEIFINNKEKYDYRRITLELKNKVIKQSMSRKGNSMDNGMLENFFGMLKTEMFCGQEDNYKTLDDLIKAIDNYIYYYNYDRIIVKLKGLSSVNCRLQSSN